MRARGQNRIVDKAQGDINRLIKNAIQFDVDASRRSHAQRTPTAVIPLTPQLPSHIAAQAPVATRASPVSPVPPTIGDTKSGLDSIIQDNRDIHPVTDNVAPGPTMRNSPRSADKESQSANRPLLLAMPTDQRARKNKIRQMVRERTMAMCHPGHGTYTDISDTAPGWRMLIHHNSTTSMGAVNNALPRALPVTDLLPIAGVNRAFRELARPHIVSLMPYRLFRLGMRVHRLDFLDLLKDLRNVPVSPGMIRHLRLPIEGLESVTLRALCQFVQAFASPLYLFRGLDLSQTFNENHYHRALLTRLQTATRATEKSFTLEEESGISSDIHDLVGCSSNLSVSFDLPASLSQADDTLWRGLLAGLMLLGERLGCRGICVYGQLLPYVKCWLAGTRGYPAELPALDPILPGDVQDEVKRGSLDEVDDILVE